MRNGSVCFGNIGGHGRLIKNNDANGFVRISLQNTSFVHSAHFESEAVAESRTNKVGHTSSVAVVACLAKFAASPPNIIEEISLFIWVRFRTYEKH